MSLLEKTATGQGSVGREHSLPRSSRSITVSDSDAVEVNYTVQPLGSEAYGLCDPGPRYYDPAFAAYVRGCTEDQRRGIEEVCVVLGT